MLITAWISAQLEFHYSILGILAMSFDVVFMLQHYVLYRSSNSDSSVGGAAESDHGDAQEAVPNERTPLV
jgi:hypothetical protein